MAPRRQRSYPNRAELLWQARFHDRRLCHQRLACGGYLHPEHPLQVLVRDTITELTGEEAAAVSTDGCGTPLFAHSLHGMARAYGRIAAADENTDEGKVAHAMRRYPQMVAGEGRDVTALMRAVPGLLAKDGFEGLQLVGLPNGTGVAVKISDGGDRAACPSPLRFSAGWASTAAAWTRFRAHPCWAAAFRSASSAQPNFQQLNQGQL